MCCGALACATTSLAGRDECNDRHEVHTIEAAAELGFGSIEYELVTIE